MAVAERRTAPWWTRPGLEARDGRLFVAGQDVEPLVRELGAPLYVYDLDRFAENAIRLLHPLGHNYYHMLREKLHWSETL